MLGPLLLPEFRNPDAGRLDEGLSGGVVQGLQVTAVTGAVVLAGLAVLTAVLLRSVPSATGTAAEPASGLSAVAAEQS